MKVRKLTKSGKLRERTRVARIMKISKSQLKRLIREEIEKSISTDPTAPTIEYFRSEIERINNRLTDQKGAGKFGKALLGWSQVGNVLTTADAIKGYVVIADNINKQGFELTKQDYMDAPIIAYLDMDKKYENLIHPRVIDEFVRQLDAQFIKMGLVGSSHMPDIDMLLEDYIEDKFEVDIRGGVNHASKEYASLLKAKQPDATDAVVAVAEEAIGGTLADITGKPGIIKTAVDVVRDIPGRAKKHYDAMTKPDPFEDLAAGIMENRENWRDFLNDSN